MVTLPNRPTALERLKPGTSRPAVAPSSAVMEDTRPLAVNVAPGERWLSAVGGSLLAVYGVRRRDLPGVAIAAVGVALVDRAVSGHSYAYETLGITTAGRRGLVQQHGPNAVLDARHARRVEYAVTIKADAGSLYCYWRDLRNLPSVMRHIVSVTEISPAMSHWVARGPAGIMIEWDAEIVNDIPGELIAWKSVHEATVPNAGSVHFGPAPGDRGTEVRVVLEYEPPAGRLGVAIARLLGEEPALQLREDLRRFKQVIETGEVVRSR